MCVLEKAGFKKEGVLKKAIVKYEEIMDEHLYALLRNK
jgi:ribosomal-protein-alanine N-acetyltransferase